MEEQLFANSGSRIKKVAMITYILWIICDVIGAIAQFFGAFAAEEYWLLLTALATVVFAPFIEYIPSLMIYSFGELIESSYQTKNILYDAIQNNTVCQDQTDDSPVVTPVEEKIEDSTAVADELNAFKELLDSGVISRDEYDAKEQELLAMLRVLMENTMDNKSAIGIAYQIKQIKQLLANGIISEQEYADMKLALLNPQKEQTYKEAVDIIDSARYVDEYERAIDLLSRIPGYKDADERIAKCNAVIQRTKEQAEKAKKEKVYKFAQELENATTNANYNVVKRLETAIDNYRKIIDYKDSADRIVECERKIKEYQALHEKEGV